MSEEKKAKKKRYAVLVQLCCAMVIEVEADDESEAESIACDDELASKMIEEAIELNVNVVETHLLDEHGNYV